MLKMFEHKAAGVVSIPTTSACVEVRRKAYCLMGQDYYYHTGCVHNEYRGLVGRHLKETLDATAEGVAITKHHLKLLSKKLRRGGAVLPWSEDMVISGYAGKKRRAYQQAYEEIIDGRGLNRRDGRVTAFVKAERRASDTNKDPRIIQHRSVKFTLTMLKYVKAVEQRLYRLKGDMPRQVKGLLVFPKHLNQDDKAQLVLDKFNSIPNCKVFSGDFSRFDQHVHLDMIKEEHAFYRSLFGNNSELSFLFRSQQKNRGKSMGGIRYWCNGRRMSGDANTSLGNNLLVWTMVVSFAMTMRGKWDVMIDGDDFLVFYEGGQELTDLDYFTQFGHKVEGQVFSRLCDVEYNQSKVCVGARGVTLVRNPFKVVDTFSVNYKHFGEPKGRRRVLKTAAQGLLALYQGVPVLQEFAAKIVEKFPNEKWLESSLEEEQLRSYLKISRDWLAIKRAEVSDEARDWFHRAFGIAPADQLSLESAAMQDFPVSLLDYGPPVDFTQAGDVVRLQW